MSAWLSALAALAAVPYTAALVSRRHGRRVALAAAVVLLLGEALLFLAPALLGGRPLQGLGASALLGWSGAAAAAVLLARQARTAHADRIR